MPYYHCRKCQHEFEAIQHEGIKLKCDWCGADRPRILEEKTPLEKMCENWQEILKEFNNAREKRDGDLHKRKYS